MANANLSKKNWRTYLSLGLSALGIVFFLIQALTMGVVLLTNLAGDQGSSTQTIPMALMLWSALFSGTLLLPVFILSLHQLRGDEVPNWLKTGRPAIRKAVLWVIAIWPAFIALGWLIAGRPMVATFLLGPINLLVAGLPVLWTFNAASWKTNGGPRLRQWRIFGFSLTVMPFMVILLELAAVLLLAVFWVIYIVYRTSVDPGLAREISLLVEQITAAGQDVDSMLLVLEPYFLQPSVLFWVAAVVGGVMPILEEVLKPIALWPLAGKEITPQERFIGGLLCGAGFAVTENLLYFSLAISQEEWLLMVIGRAGTGILHMLASGLVGWGMVKTWRSGKWGAQVVLSLGAFILHSLWNVLALFVGIAPEYLIEPGPTLGQMVLFYIPIIVLLILSIAGIYLINRRFRNQNNKGFEGQNEELQEEIKAVIS